MGKKDEKNKPDPQAKYEKLIAKYQKPMNPMKFARQMMRAYVRPGKNAINRQMANVEEDYGQYANQLDSIYGAVSAAMPNINAYYNSQAQGAYDALAQANQGLGQYMGTMGPAGELAAAGGYLGTMGAAGNALLAAQQGRNAAYGASAARQAPIDQATAKANALTEMQQLLDDLGQQKLDLRSEARANLPGWAQSGQEYNLALMEYLLRKQALEGQLAGYGAVNDYYTSTLDQGPGKGNDGNQGGGGPLQAFLSGQTKWNQLSQEQKVQVRDALRENPGLVRQTFPSLKPRTYGSVNELIQAIIQMLKGPMTPAWSPGSQGGPQYD